ncbi:MAG: NADH-quinone oxidoreductase subunit H [Euryarchaeota archaeon]|nr:NADH-quinone oxidoreductase subunit H [Euryarchaeota archaeon]
MAVSDFYVTALQAALVLAVSPLLMTVFLKVKAWTQRRRGPPLLQPYADLMKLMEKDEVVSDTASPVFLYAPAVAFAATFAAAMLVPTFFGGAAVFTIGDLFVVVFLLSLARFAMALAALDTGSGFGGFGSSRDVILSAIVEPTLVGAILWGALVTGSTGGPGLAIDARPLPLIAALASYGLVIGSLIIVVLAETGRIPVDNPSTHLELTMIHEAMTLEYSGPRLALVEMTKAMRQFLFVAMLLLFAAPFGFAPDHDGIVPAIVLFMAKILAVCLALAFVETTTAKWRLFRLPELFTVGIALSVLAVMSAVVARGTLHAP